MYFETIEYPCLRNLLRSTAFLQIFFDTEKANLLGVEMPILEIETKKWGVTKRLPVEKTLENKAFSILLCFGSILVFFRQLRV